MSEQPPTEKTMVEFAAASDYDRVVFLVASEFDTKKKFRQSDNPLGKIFPPTNTIEVYYHTAGKVFGVICDKDKLLNKAEPKADSIYGYVVVFTNCAAKIAETFSADI